MESIYHERLVKYFVAAQLDARGAEIRENHRSARGSHPLRFAVQAKPTSFSPLWQRQQKGRLVLVASSQKPL